MRRVIHVITIVPELYAGNWIAMLFARDWRTRLAGEAASLDDLAGQLKRPAPVDAVVIDSRVLTGDDAQRRFLALAVAHPGVRFLWLVDTPDLSIFGWMPAGQMLGQVCKNDIRHSLVWALVIGMENLVISPAVRTQVLHSGKLLPLDTEVLDGRATFPQLTEHDLEVARLALVFSMERRDMSDELAISQDWTFGLVSGLYKKLGLDELLSGQVDLDEYLGSRSLIADHIRAMIAELGGQHNGSRRAKDMETLAFHLLTMPDVQRLY